MEALMFVFNDVKNIKKSDIMVIFGSGASINDLEEKEIKKLSQYDTIGFNFFCFSNIPTTYYLVREQANIPKRINGDENIDNFIKIINKCYFNSYLIIHDISHHSPNAFNYADNCNRFCSSYVVVKDIKFNNNEDGVKIWRETNIINNGLIHGKCTLNNILHFAVQMDYKKIIFVGVDLYDSRYFWIKKGDTRYSVKNKNKNYKSKHAISGHVLNMIKNMTIIYPDIDLYTYNSKSLLKDIIPVWEK